MADQEQGGRQDSEQHKPSDMQDRSSRGPDFSGFIAGLYTQTLLSMGLIGDPRTGEKRVELKEAQFLIDTIGMLEQKTRGNLSEQEAGYMQGILNDLRMRYVNAVRKAANGEKDAEESVSNGGDEAE